MAIQVPINESIRSDELRVVGSDGENYGVISKTEAIKKAKEQGLDLIEISPNAKPPVAKITDYGKFQYEQKKKKSEIKAKAHVTETKTIQIKIGTGDHDLNLKAKRIIEWLEEGHRVKADLFLRGRYKYMEFKFLKGRLEEFLTRVTVPFKIADQIKKSPKGLSCTLERDGKIKPKSSSQKETAKAEPVDNSNSKSVKADLKKEPKAKADSQKKTEEMKEAKS